MSKNFAKQLLARASLSRELQKGSFLFHEGDRVAMIFVVDRGLVELSRRQLDGASIVLQRAMSGAVLAESSLYSMAYHCDAIAARRSVVSGMPKRAFAELLDEDQQFSRSWAAHLAAEVRAARTRCDIMARKTVAGRLDGWLAWHGDELPHKGRWKSVAEQIGVSPEALYRELAKRRNGS